MLPILVLALAASAFAAPGVQNIRQVNSNEIGPFDNSALSSFFDLNDGGDKYVSELNLGSVLRDQFRAGNQAQVLGQSLATFGEVVTGLPGDACAAANYINAYTNYVRGGSAGAVRETFAGFVNSIAEKIDRIVALATNRNSAKYASGVRGGCPNGGRTYQFDDAWDIILGTAGNVGLTQELFSATKRMYCALPARVANAGASMTAAALPPSSQLWDLVSEPLANFISSAGSKANIGAAAAGLKQAMRVNLNNVKY